MSERLPVQPGIIQLDQLPGQLAPLQGTALEASAKHNLSDRLRNRWTTGLAIAATVLAVSEGPSFDVEPAYAADPPQVTIGMPFQGKWAYVNAVTPPYTEANSSHPSVHESYSFQWATDLYVGANTAVKLRGSSSQGTVTFKHIGTSDTCSSQGAGIGGSAATFGVYVDTTKVGEIKYDHLDLESDFTGVDNDSFSSGTKIGEITTEPLNANCYQVSHAHVQFKNSSNQSCYVDHGATGQTLAEGTGLGILGSSNTTAKQPCSTTPTPTPASAVLGDYNGDSITDAAVYRPSDGMWHIRGVGDFQWGGWPGDIPVPADYNGDNITDVAIYRPQNGGWYIRNVGVYSYGWNGDIPVPGDYNGDGSADIAIYRPSDGMWHIRGVGDFQWGGWPGDIPVPGDYNNDKSLDIAIYRPQNGGWYVRNVDVYSYGWNGDIPVPADYNGDNITDVAIYRPSEGGWHIRGVGDWPHGWSTDIPVPGRYNDDENTDAAIYRPSDGGWRIRAVGDFPYGMSTDIPAVQTLNAMLLQQYGLIQGY